MHLKSPSIQADKIKDALDRLYYKNKYTGEVELMPMEPVN